MSSSSTRMQVGLLPSFALLLGVVMGRAAVVLYLLQEHSLGCSRGVSSGTKATAFT